MGEKEVKKWREEEKTGKEREGKKNLEKRRSRSSRETGKKTKTDTHRHTLQRECFYIIESSNYPCIHVTRPLPYVQYFRVRSERIMRTGIHWPELSG